MAPFGRGHAFQRRSKDKELQGQQAAEVTLPSGQGGWRSVWGRLSQSRRRTIKSCSAESTPSPPQQEVLAVQSYLQKETGTCWRGGSAPIAIHQSRGGLPTSIPEAPQYRPGQGSLPDNAGFDSPLYSGSMDLLCGSILPFPSLKQRKERVGTPCPGDLVGRAMASRAVAGATGSQQHHPRTPCGKTFTDHSNLTFERLAVGSAPVSCGPWTDTVAELHTATFGTPQANRIGHRSGDSAGKSSSSSIVCLSADARVLHPRTPLNRQPVGSVQRQLRWDGPAADCSDVMSKAAAMSHMNNITHLTQRQQQHQQEPGLNTAQSPLVTFQPLAFVGAWEKDSAASEAGTDIAELLSLAPLEALARQQMCGLQVEESATHLHLMWVIQLANGHSMVRREVFPKSGEELVFHHTDGLKGACVSRLKSLTAECAKLTSEQDSPRTAKMRTKLRLKAGGEVLKISHRVDLFNRMGEAGVGSATQHTYWRRATQE